MLGLGPGWRERCTWVKFGVNNYNRETHGGRPGGQLDVVLEGKEGVVSDCGFGMSNE